MEAKSSAFFSYPRMFDGIDLRMRRKKVLALVKKEVTKALCAIGGKNIGKYIEATPDALLIRYFRPSLVFVL